MNIMITGAKGFMGKNLRAALLCRREDEVLDVDQQTDPLEMDEYCRKADFVFHLAGVNRPLEEIEFMKGNRDFTAMLLESLKKHGNRCPVMLSSSIQAALDNPYGQSKRAAEELLFHYGEETGASVLVYRFPNVFGKWSRPDYNSVVATYCHLAARGMPLRVDDPEAVLKLVYIDDLIEELLRGLDGRPARTGRFCEVPVTYTAALGMLADRIVSFRANRTDLNLPDLGDPLTKKLYSTYLTYLPEEGFSYPLPMKADDRGTFTEFIKTPDRGQVSVNIIRPGIVKGNHWHQSKNEKFLVVRGEGVIRLRRIDAGEILSYPVWGDRLEVVDIPPGFTHQIENLGDEDLIAIMWANEAFDPDCPDTFFMEV